MCFAIGAHGASQGQTTCFQAAPSQTTAKHGIRKIREFQGTKNGGDFNTKKMLVLQGSRPNPDPWAFFRAPGAQTQSFFERRFFPFQTTVFTSPGRTLSGCTSFSSFFGCAKDAFKLFLSLYQPPGNMVSPKSCTFSTSRPFPSG